MFQPNLYAVKEHLTAQIIMDRCAAVKQILLIKS